MIGRGAPRSATTGTPSGPAVDAGDQDETAPQPAPRAGLTIAVLCLALVVVVSLVHLSVDRPQRADAATEPRSAKQAIALPRLGATSSGSSGTAGASGSSSTSEPATGSSASPSAGATDSGSSLTAQPAQQVGADAQQPNKLVLPDGTVVPVLAVGTTDGQLNVPEDIRNAGWWRGGARLGDPFGAMLIAAHVDSLTQGLGPYAQLLSARKGQKVVVSSSMLKQNFVLASRQVVPRESLPQRHSIFSSAGSPRLVMVTCSGPYIKSEGGYQNLAILTATPSGQVKTKG